MDDIIEQSNYCLNCKNKPCKNACPLGNDIPNAIQYVKHENYKMAYKVLTKTSVLQSICGRICPHMQQCMWKCTRGIKQNPVDIGSLEAFIGDIALSNNFPMEELDKDCVGKKVAIIGSGPSRTYMCCFFGKKGC